MTVSRVLRGAGGFSATTRERVLAAVRDLGYSPNAIAQGLRNKQTRTVALLIGNVASPFFAQLASGFEAAVRDAGYVAMICNTDQSASRESEYLAELLQRRIDGLAVAPVESDSPALRSFAEQGVPIVLVDRDAPSLQLDGVTSDGFAGAMEATRHLIEAHGHRRIAALCGPEETSTGRDRRAGYEAALRAAGIEPEAALVGHSAFTIPAARALALELLTRSPRPTALLVTGNFLTAGALEAMAELGLAVPGDVALIGFGPAPRSPLECPDLTMVGLPSEAMGRRAGRLLLQRIKEEPSGDDDRDVIREAFPTELLIGTSCGCP